MPNLFTEARSKKIFLCVSTDIGFSHSNYIKTECVAPVEQWMI